MADGIAQARDAFDRQAWRSAYEQLSEAARDESLGIDDLERLASAAYLSGRPEESYDAWARAHQQCADLGEIARAVRAAFWIAFALLNAGEVARGGGWVDRAQRLLDQRKLRCVEQGYIRYVAAVRSIFSGDVAAAHETFGQAIAIGERFHDPEITALARIGQGRCLVYMGEVGAGIALLDEAMVAVGAGEVSPIATGDAYCTVIDGCHELFDIRRTYEWTAALSRWCDAQPELVLYRGRCLLHRAEIMMLRGAWSDATAELERACERLAAPLEPPSLGGAEYLRGEIHRLRGEYADAEDRYRAANELGRDPQPGLALLRVAQNRIEPAVAAIRRAREEADDPITLARVIGPVVDIELTVGNVDAARAAADQLDEIATALGQPFIDALAAQVTGAVLLAENDAAAALVSLRRAWRTWRELEVPYEAARTRLLIAEACRALGDGDGCEMELDAARAAFAELGATADELRAESMSGLGATSSSGDLTGREIEVLKLVAKGRKNREIADALVISEKTVASHLSHIFTKLDISSRSAATAYAYERGLVE